MYGNNTAAPKKHLKLLKVYGPTYFVPADCATNANPQINAAVNSNNDLPNFFAIVPSSPFKKTAQQDVAPCMLSL